VRSLIVVLEKKKKCLNSWTLIQPLHKLCENVIEHLQKTQMTEGRVCNVTGRVCVQLILYCVEQLLWITGYF